MTKKSNSVSPVILQDGSFQHADHGKAVTRRQMLRNGSLTSAGWLMAPQLAWLAKSSSAKADVTCSEDGANAGYVPFLVFDLEGGPGLPGNFLVTKDDKSQDLLRSYSLLGWDPRESGALDTSFGLPMSRKYSKVLEGIVTTTSATTRANLRMGSLCHFSQDDSNINKTSPLTLINKLGFGGEYLRVGIGTRNTLSGGNSDVVVRSAKDRPVFVNSISAINAAVSFGPAFAALSSDQRAMIADSLNALQGDQIGDFASRMGGSTLADAAKCAYKKLKDFSAPITEIDPRKNAILQAIYGINDQTSVTDPNALQAAIALNVLNAYSGPGVVSVPGCDYHQLGQTFTDSKDLEIGQAIGRAVEAAAQLNKPLFFQILTDGGVSATSNTRLWSSDSGDKSMTVIGYFNPSGAPQMRRTQVGRYTDGQGADRSTLIGGDPAKVAYAVFANYLSVIGRRGEFSNIAGRIFNSEAEIDSLLIF